MRQNYNKKNKGLALLGQGKWKHALGCTLVLMGFMMGFGMMGAYAQLPTNGLYMHKDWVPNYDDCPNGDCGYIRLETFVTGDKIITETHKPSDIVLVLDVSGSMNDNISEYTYTARTSQAYTYNNYTTTYYYYYEGEYYAVSRGRQYQGLTRYRFLYFERNGVRYYLGANGPTTTMPTNATSNGATMWTGVLYNRTVVPGTTQTKMAALKTAVNAFVSKIAKDAVDYDVDHYISIVKYASNAYYDDPQSSVTPETDLTEGNHRGANNNNNYNYTEVLINRRDPRTADSTYIKNQVNALQSGGATASDFGMNKARYLLASIPENQLEGRSKVVVLFTDGSPTYQSNFSNDVANNTIGYAHDLKHSADDLLAPYSGNEYQFDATVFTVGVFDNETDNIHTYMSRTSSNYPDATSMTNTCVETSQNYYFTAESAESLSSIFESIAQESGGSAYDLGSETVVQDVIASSFQLDIPSGQSAATTIKAYAPKCNGKNGNTYAFEPETDGASRLTLDDDGVVNGGAENRLADGIVDYDPDTKTLTFTDFNFAAMYVSQETNPDGTPYLDPVTQQPVFTGRKLVMLIPLRVEEGTWGDDMVTNGPLSIIQPNGDTLNPLYFNVPTANVIGTVWTEVITEEPEGFKLDSIDTPEELAWFISVVNGRARYKDNNTVVPTPNASARLTADIDMSAHNWVSIGEGTTGYTGTFDGNGHVITGLKNNATKYYKLNERAMVYPGMFSNVKGTVKNLFVLDADFRAKNHLLKPEDEQKTFIHFGIIADTLSTNGQIFNCEAAGRITCNTNIDNLERDTQMIFGGLVGYNDGGTIHSTMTMAELTGYTLGGAVGLNNGPFSNSFTNGVYNYMDNGVTGKYVGGIAAQNTGSINNCYVRFERANQNLDKTNFGMLVGTGTTPTNSYTPQIVTWSRPDFASTTTAINTNLTVPTNAVAPNDNPSTSYTLSVSPTFYNMFTNDNMTGGTWGTLGSYNVYNNGTPLLDKLNAGKGGGASWKRTTAGVYSEGAGDINDDYPVLMFPEYTCLGSADGIRIDYATSLDEMLHRHNNGNMNENTSLAESYKKTRHEAVYKGTINLYAHDVTDHSTTDSVVVYIDENISLLQDASSSIEAYTGQTLKAFGIVQGDLQAGDRWHNVSSSLSNSQFGWDYLCDSIEPTQVAHNFESDPCGWHLNNHDEDHALFPIDLSSYHRGDFYCFYEPEYHWLNFRRNSLSHWHMDNYTQNIEYENETAFVPGKGYLMSVDMSTWADYGREAQFLQNRGTLNNGEISIPVTYTADNEWTGLAGYNLLGNPYQSYLDFATFAAVNSDLWNNDANAMTYAVYDPTLGIYAQATAAGQASQGAFAATGDINMHQGFFICAKKSGTATFNNTMRSITPAAGTQFRGERLNYPVINLIATDSEGNTDVAVLEVGRPENGGGEKLRVGSATGRISLRHDDTDFGILFRDMTEGSQPLRFETQEDGTFTLSWNTANANFSSLTLVDNITGVNYDMLTHDSYEFEGRASDYKSRFKILIGEFNDVEENEDPSTSSGTFAFYDGSEWIVNGQGQLVVADVMGRMVYTDNLTNDQNHVSLNGLSQGVYLMQVHSANGTMVQKIVVR